jgi:hypothetical protein
VWSGVLPVADAFGMPILVPDDGAGLALPPSVLSALSRKTGRRRRDRP